MLLGYAWLFELPCSLQENISTISFAMYFLFLFLVSFCLSMSALIRCMTAFLAGGYQVFRYFAAMGMVITGLEKRCMAKIMAFLDARFSFSFCSYFDLRSRSLCVTAIAS